MKNIKKIEFIENLFKFLIKEIFIFLIVLKG